VNLPVGTAREEEEKEEDEEVEAEEFSQFGILLAAQPSAPAKKHMQYQNRKPSLRNVI